MQEEINTAIMINVAILTILAYSLLIWLVGKKSKLYDSTGIVKQLYCKIRRKPIEKKSTTIDIDNKLVNLFAIFENSVNKLIKERKEGLEKTLPVKNISQSNYDILKNLFAEDYPIFFDNYFVGFFMKLEPLFKENEREQLQDLINHLGFGVVELYQVKIQNKELTKTVSIESY